MTKFKIIIYTIFILLLHLKLFPITDQSRKGPIFNPQPLWILKSSKPIITKPAYSDGTIYFGSLNNHIYAVDYLTGSIKWYKKLDHKGDEPVGVHSSLVIYHDMVIVANGDGFLYALDKNSGEPAVDPPNTITDKDFNELILNKLKNPNDKIFILKCYTQNSDVDNHYHLTLFKERSQILKIFNLIKFFQGRTTRSYFDLRQNVYSTPARENNLLFVSTFDDGLLWVIDLDKWELYINKPFSIGSQVYSKIITENFIEQENIFKFRNDSTGSIVKRNTEFHYIHITVPNSIITFRFDPDTKLFQRLPDITFDRGSITSDPVLHDSKLYFSTRQYLYCINLRLRSIIWVKRVDPIQSNLNRKTYPGPIISKNILFHGAVGYNLEQGNSVWHLWTYGDISTDPITSNTMLYTGGNYIKYDRSYGYIAGVDIKTETVTFLYTLPSGVLSPIALHQGILYFSTDNNTIYALR